MLFQWWVKFKDIGPPMRCVNLLTVHLLASHLILVARHVRSEFVVYPTSVSLWKSTKRVILHKTAANKTLWKELYIEGTQSR